jgi:hypothetical protein
VITVGGTVTSEDLRNGDYPWDSFDPEHYLRQNYATVHEDDRRTLSFVRDFFAEAFADDPVPAGRRGIDVGTGANLYPALAMLPFCDRLTLYEHSRANVDWLVGQQCDGWPSWAEVWEDFWLVLREGRAYDELGGNPRHELAKRADVIEGSVFALRGTGRQWDIGTMFFVAESITPAYAEFLAAVDHFLGVLRPGAPFAIAFMEHSTGYQVAGNHFPAIAIGADDILRCLFRRAAGVTIQRTVAGAKPLRDGYRGMILACGRAMAGIDEDRTGTTRSTRSRG